MKLGLGRICLSLLGGILAANGANAAHQFESGGWLGKSYIDASGGFASCVIASRVKNNYYLLFKLTRTYDFSLGVGNGLWSWQKGEQKPIIIAIDGKFSLKGNAIAVSKNVLSVPLPSTSSLMGALRHGRLIKFSSGKLTATFTLGSADDALTKLASCVRQGLEKNH